MAPWATTTQNFLSIKQGVVNKSPNKVDSAIFQTRAGIPKDGNHGAFGYGVITASGTVIVLQHTRAFSIVKPKAQKRIIRSFTIITFN